MDEQKKKNRTVLVVDDDDGIREAVRNVLEEEGCIVHTACNGREALDTLSTIPRPCLILLDLMMPVMDGWEVMEALKADDASAAIPVAVVSSLFSRDDYAARFFRKPIALETLIEVVRAHCGNGSDPA